MEGSVRKKSGAGESPDEKPPIALDAMRDYTNGGGRVFATHYHYYWFEYEPASASVATWTAPFADGDYKVDTSFPKGSDFADWLQNIHATTTRKVIRADDLRTMSQARRERGELRTERRAGFIQDATGRDNTRRNT